VTVSNVLIERIDEVEGSQRTGAWRRGLGIVASDGRSVPVPGDGATIRITAGRMLSLLAGCSGLVARSCERIAYGLQDDLVGADTEELAELAHLGHLRHPPPALPEVDRLRLDAHLQRQLELGPSLV
jgi:hypothetical protein